MDNEIKNTEMSTEEMENTAGGVYIANETKNGLGSFSFTKIIKDLFG